MIAKYWLEDIKERFVKYQSDYNLNGEDVEWLIQRVEELEEENDELAEGVHKLALDWSELVDERNRYKQALEEILNADCNLEGLDAERELDRVTDIALKALEVEERWKNITSKHISKSKGIDKN